MNDNEVRCDDMDLLIPRFRNSVEALLRDLASEYVRGRIFTRFAVFETYRSPRRQLQLLQLGKTKARPWQSAHQFGLAVDIVPREVDPATGRERWTWNPTDRAAWDALRAAAIRHGLDNSIPWDRAHVEHSRLLAELRFTLQV